MNLSNTRSNPFGFMSNIKVSPSFALGIIIITALCAFEMFNYSTTDYALHDLLGDLKFAGIPWATILAVAFCGIDFAGIARLFTPEQGAEEPKEVWYLFGAWLLAATMNAILTWWGVSMAIVNHSISSTAVIPANMLTKIVPAFVAIMVWVIRILIIGSLSVSGDRLLLTSQRRTAAASRSTSPTLGHNLGSSLNSPAAASRSAAPARPAPRTLSSIDNGLAGRPEPTYHSLSMGARPTDSGSSTRRM